MRKGQYCASFVLASSILSIEMYKCIEELNPTYLNYLQYKPVIINFVTRIDWSSKIHVPYSNKVIFDVIFYQTILKSELESVSVYTYLMSFIILWFYSMLTCWYMYSWVCVCVCAPGMCVCVCPMYSRTIALYEIIVFVIVVDDWTDFK